MRKLGIVIVNYNGAKFQNACVDSILQSDYDDFYLATKVLLWIMARQMNR